MTTSGGTAFLSAGGDLLLAENGAPQDLPLPQGPLLRDYVTCASLSSAKNEVKDGIKVGGPLTHAHLCPLGNTEREAVRGVNVCSCMEDVENSTDEGYETRRVCQWG
eukprot:jgi/Tetstr1/465884/TSEL_010501.t1